MKMLSLACALVFLLTPASVFAEDESPDTPLHMAVITGDIVAVRQHIEAGTDLDQRDDFGSTPLVIAAVFDRPEIADALLAAWRRRIDTGPTRIHAIAYRGLAGPHRCCAKPA
jgi:hypothetical protein